MIKGISRKITDVHVVLMCLQDDNLVEYEADIIEPLMTYNPQKLEEKLLELDMIPAGVEVLKIKETKSVEKMYRIPYEYIYGFGNVVIEDIK